MQIPPTGAQPDMCLAKSETASVLMAERTLSSADKDRGLRCESSGILALKRKRVATEVRQGPAF